MAKSWNPRITRIRNGDAVNAGNTNRAARQLEARTDYLKERVDGMENAEAIAAWHAPISPDVLENQPVFWNSETKRFELAIAGAELDDATQQYLPTDEADCLGVLLTKVTADSGHVALQGIIPLNAVENAIDGEVLPGRYYLSATEAGKLVRQRPAQATYVLTVLGEKDSCEDRIYAYVSPHLRDTGNDHVHYRFSLACVPAGVVEPPAEGEVHVITDPDETVQGWLPAEHDVFDGKAPMGAAFGYNLAAHPAIDRLWPPLPIAAVAMLWDKGESHSGATEVPLGANGLVIVDVNGIWWMSNCYGDVPWPTLYDSDSDYSDVSESLECPRTEHMRLELLFERTTYGADKTVVTSLAPAEDSPLSFKNCDGEEATTGDLLADINIALLVADETVAGGQVLKTLVGPYKFGRGWVAEGLKAGSTQVTLQSTHSYLATEDDETSRVHQGVVTVDINTGIDRELSPQLQRLGDAVERPYRNVMYIGLPEGRDSSIVARFDIPATGIPTNPVVTVKLLLLGTLAGDLPALPLGYKVVAEPTDDEPASEIPASETAVTVDTELTVEANKVYKTLSDSFSVVAGDTLLVSLSRASDSGYLGEVGLVRIVAVLSAGE